MERIVYQKTLDVHKNGVQFTLQGFETADKVSRRIKLSLTASGDAIEFPLEKIMAIMYVHTPNATEPSIIECTIKDNAIIYDVLPIVEEGITEIQCKLIETSPEGATAVLATPKFSVEVTKSNMDEESATQSTSFSALEDALAKAKTVYDERFLRMELSSDCMFRAYYADGTVYESDVLKELFHQGDSLLAQSFARGDTGIRTGEQTDNAMYYSKVSQSASVEAQAIKDDAIGILDEVKLHGIYTAFSVDFETGKVEYVSPYYEFKVNTENGNLDVIGKAYTFEEDIEHIVEEWLLAREFDIAGLVKASDDHTKDIGTLQDKDTKNDGWHSFMEPIIYYSEGKIQELESYAGNCQIKVGAYTGDGNYGPTKKNSLTFEFVPQFVSIRPQSSYNCNIVDLVNGQTKCNTDSYSNTDRYIEVEWNDKTVSWYAQYNGVSDGQSARNQLNTDGTTYYYIALGYGGK